MQVAENQLRVASDIIEIKITELCRVEVFIGNNLDEINFKFDFNKKY